MSTTSGAWPTADRSMPLVSEAGPELYCNHDDSALRDEVHGVCERGAISAESGPPHPRVIQAAARLRAALDDTRERGRGTDARDVDTSVVEALDVEDIWIVLDAPSAPAQRPAPEETVVYLVQREDQDLLYGFHDEPTAASYSELFHDAAAFPLTIESSASAPEMVARVIGAQEREGPRGVCYRTKADIPPGHDLVAASDLSPGDRIVGWFHPGISDTPRPPTAAVRPAGTS